MLTHGLTKNISHSILPKKGDRHLDNEINRVLISRPNGRLGNLLLITPLIQDIVDAFPNCKIDILVKGGLAPILFQNYENVDRIIQLPKRPFSSLFEYLQKWASIKNKRYDLVINAAKGSSSGRLSTKIATSKYKIFGEGELVAISEKYGDYEHIAKYPVYAFREFLMLLNFEIDRPVPDLDLKLSVAEIASGKEILENLVGNGKKTIAIFTYATCMKCYSIIWWEEFYEKLKTEFPGYAILEILPVENVSQIGFKAISFYSKYIREIGAVIANTTIFIGADSGIMHLASAVKIPTAGLFSVTNPKIYAPYNPKSIAVDTNHCRAEDCIKVLKEML